MTREAVVERGDRMLASRYEFKYVVPERLVPAIRRFIAPFTRPDAYAAGRPDHAYVISSLYLDTPDLLLYRMTREGVKNRFKLRLRTYSDDAATPVFCEIKRRMNRVILKRRARVGRDVAARVFPGEVDREVRRALESVAGLDEFLTLWATSEARPVCRVRYRREAYEAATGEPLRITFDHDLVCNPTAGFDLRLWGPGWLPAGPPGVVLEIKFTERFPPWVAEMVRSFELGAQSVPKYVLSVQRLGALPGLSGALTRPAGFAPAAGASRPGGAEWIR